MMSRNVSQYEPGDYVKVEFESNDPLPGEWMWVRIAHCDERRRLIFGRLDNEPVLDTDNLRLGDELAISYDKVREHRKPWEFKRNC